MRGHVFIRQPLACPAVGCSRVRLIVRVCVLTVNSNLDAVEFIPRSDAGARYTCLLKPSLLHSRFVFSDPDPIKHLRPEQYRARKQAAVDRSAACLRARYCSGVSTEAFL